MRPLGKAEELERRRRRAVELMAGDLSHTTIAEILGVMWSMYFLWRRNWIGAVIVGVLGFLLSTILLWNKPIEGLATTQLGKIMAVYTTPLNFMLYNLSALPVIYGLWTHSVVFILLGYTILLLPHLWAWK